VTGVQAVVAAYNTAAPITVKARQTVRDETMAAAKAGDDDAKLARSVDTAATPEAATGMVQDRQYKTIGTQAQRDANALWSSIVYDPAPPTIAYIDENGATQFIKGSEIAAAGEPKSDARKQVADFVLTSRGEAGFTDSLRAQRDEFQAGHPEYAAFKEWQGSLPDDPELPAYREELSKGNPNAARAIADQEAYLATQEEPGSPAYLDRLNGWTRSQAMYNAIQGTKTSVYDANPTATRSDQAAPPFDPANPATDYTPFPGGASPSAQLKLEMDAYSRGMDMVDAALTQRYGQPIDLSTVHPDVKKAIKGELAMMGVPMPDPGPNLIAYWDWQKYIPPGADDSMEAYARWQQTGGWAQKGTGAPLVPGQTSADAYAYLGELLGVPARNGAANGNPALTSILNPPPQTGNPVVQTTTGQWAETNIMGLPQNVVRVAGVLYQVQPDGSLVPWQG
jgi:hypothetical protein